MSQGHTSQLSSNSTTQKVVPRAWSSSLFSTINLYESCKNTSLSLKKPAKGLKPFFSSLMTTRKYLFRFYELDNVQGLCTFEQSDRNSNCYSVIKAWSGATPLILPQISEVTLCIFCYRERGFYVLSLSVLAATYSQSEETHWSTSPFPSLLIFYLVSRAVRQKTVFREIFEIFKGCGPRDTREGERVLKKLNSGLQQQTHLYPRCRIIKRHYIQSTRAKQLSPGTPNEVGIFLLLGRDRVLQTSHPPREK